MTITMADRAVGWSSTTASVVVVDDERDLADLVASYLIRDGFDVRILADGARAV